MDILLEMRIRSFEFNLRELAGSMGDFGTLFPLAIGYIAVCDVNPAGLLVMTGLANILTGIAFRLPVPIEPMKVIATAAISRHWSPSMVYASAFAMGVTWLIFAWTGIMGWIARVAPVSFLQPFPPSVSGKCGRFLCWRASPRFLLRRQMP